jgi:glycosyltransferase involved in cell wall biosynthesis
VNRTTFTDTWAKALASKPVNGDLITYEMTPKGKKRILVIDHHLPMPDRDSGSLRMFQILNILHQLGHRVTFLPDNLADLPPYGDDLRKRGIEVIHQPYAATVREFLEKHGAFFDVVILSRRDFARKHIADVRSSSPQSRVIFDTVDLHFLRDDRAAELAQDPELERNAQENRQIEFDLIDAADQTWVVSPVEQELLRAECPQKSVEIVSNIVDVPGCAAPFSQRRDLLFIGSFLHPPNIDAVVFFALEIFPIVHARLPDLKCYVIGAKAPPEVLALDDDNIVLTGFQPDVSQHFNRARLSIAPLRVGAGVKGKINQSMAFGVPVVATSLAVEGMGLTPGENVLVADDPMAFASAIVELYGSEGLWQRLSSNSVTKMKECYSVEAARRQLQRVLAAEHACSGERHSAGGGTSAPCYAPVGRVRL